MTNFRQCLETLIASKQQVGINFCAATGTKLVSISGIVAEVGDDFFLIHDIYGNSMAIPFTAVAFIEIKK
ncbi:MAG: hypothetical protein LIP77_04075 [Planctomycetes bacterium]|nr:hypothetical protein [Planctomycetota bacterium]